jgi:hypothetical protein
LVGVVDGDDAGWLPTLIAVAAGGALLRHQVRGIERAREGGLPDIGTGAGLVITAMGLVAAMVLVAGMAGVVGDLLTEFPACIWTLPLAALALAMRGRYRNWAFGGLAICVPFAGVVGNGFEARGAEAQGAAYSGPIAGIHPFQTTAITIDGYGPFDLPINDYVEPTGERGYGPVEFGDTVEQALHAIAERHFADGPARARLAFGQARVETTEVPQLRDELTNPLSVGFAVFSGTHGPRSRVEFGCPGSLNDPRGPSPYVAMRDSCPTKYAAEASAGLGVTGRWPGYTEMRGNSRLSLSRVMRLDRRPSSSKAPDYEHVAWFAILVVAAIASSRRNERESLATVAGLASCFALLVGLVLLTSMVGAPVTRVIGSLDEPASLLAWLLAIPAAGAMALRPSTKKAEPAIAVAATVGLALLGAVWISSSAHAATWLSHASPSEVVMRGADAAITSAAGATFGALGLDVLELEAALASMLVTVLLGAIVVVVSDASRATARLGLGGDKPRHWPPVLVGLGALGLGALGGIERLGIVLAVALLACLVSALATAGAREGGPARSGLLVHLAVVGLAVAALTGTFAGIQATGGGTLGVILGVLLCVASVGVLFGRRSRGQA